MPPPVAADGSDHQTTSRIIINFNVKSRVIHTTYQHIVFAGILYHVQANGVQIFLLELDLRIFLGHFATASQKQPIGHTHNVGLVHGRHLRSIIVDCILEGIFGHTTRCIFRDQFDALHHTVDNFVFDARVFAFGVLANGHHIHIVIQSFVALETATRTHICIQIELFAQLQIQRAMSFADRCHQWALEADFVAIDRIDGRLGNAEFTIGMLWLIIKSKINRKKYLKMHFLVFVLASSFGRFEVMKTHPNRCHINCFPFQRHIGCFEDLLHGSRNFRSDTIARDQCDFAHIARIWAAAIDWCKVYLSNGEKKNGKTNYICQSTQRDRFYLLFPLPISMHQHS